MKDNIISKPFADYSQLKMPLLTFVMFLVVITTNCIIAQQLFNPDSLQKIVNTQLGREKIFTLRHLSRAYNGRDSEKSIFYGKKAVEESKLFNQDSLIIMSLNNLALAYQNSGAFQTSLEYFDNAISLSRKNNFIKDLAYSLSFKATSLAGMKQTDKALPIAQEALTFGEQIKDSILMLNALEIVAAAYKDLHQYEEAIKVYTNEEKMLDALPKRLFEKGRLMVNFGEAYYGLGNEERALELYQSGRIFFYQLEYPIGVMAASQNIAELSMKHKDYIQAKKVYEELNKLSKSVHEPTVQALSLVGLGKIATHEKKYTDAENYYQKAKIVASDNKLYNVLKEVYLNLNDLYCLKGNFEEAGKYKKLSEVYSDSVFNSNVLDKISEYQVKYETLQKEKDISDKELKIKTQEIEIGKKNILNYTLLASIIALGLISWLIFNRVKLQKKAEIASLLIQQQQLGLKAAYEAQEIERKRIAKDLHDGIVQELVALKLGLTKLINQLKNNHLIVPENIQSLSDQLDGCCTDLRNISHVMLPPVLEQSGIVAALQNLILQYNSHSEITGNFDFGKIPDQLDPSISVGLYRIAQELITNVVKHAKANTFNLQVYTINDNIIMRMEDDGIGFDPDEGKAKGSMGLLNMASRASTLGGTYSVEHAEPSGNVTTIKIPFNIHGTT